MKRVALLALFLAAAACSSSDEIGSSESAVKVCGQTTVKGIDVYHYDNGANPIDWTAVKNAGASFAFVKATESTNFTDASFATNWKGLKTAGLVRGAYHFFHSDVDPNAQATYFLSVVGKVTTGDLLVLDLESANGQTQATILANALTFMKAVKNATGTTPILYTSPAFLSNFGGLGAYPLWVANYGVSCPDVPAAWKTYTFWQSTGSGTFPAITGAVDLDTFNGTVAELTAFANGTSATGDAGTGDASADAASDAATTNDAATTSDAAPIADAAGDAAGGEVQETGGCSVASSNADLGWLAALVIAAEASRRRRRAAPATAR